jgi:hypothetical protein
MRRCALPNQQLGSTAVRAAALLSLELALPPRQRLFGLTQIAGVVNVAAVGQRGEVLQAQPQA